MHSHSFFQIWHKGCFKCTECGMTLNMKTYKGFNKSPYCEAHIPKAKATTVAETPELKRIQENTKHQSNVRFNLISKLILFEAHNLIIILMNQVN